MLSDNGSIYLSASEELKKLSSSPTLMEAHSRKVVQWKFLLKWARWFRGFWEKLIRMAWIPCSLVHTYPEVFGKLPVVKLSAQMLYLRWKQFSTYWFVLPVDVRIFATPMKVLGRAFITLGSLQTIIVEFEAMLNGLLLTQMRTLAFKTQIKHQNNLRHRQM